MGKIIYVVVKKFYGKKFYYYEYGLAMSKCQISSSNFLFFKFIAKIRQQNRSK